MTTKKFILLIAVLALFTFESRAQEQIGINKTDTLLKDTINGLGSQSPENIYIISTDTLLKDSIIGKESKTNEKIEIAKKDTLVMDSIAGNASQLKEKIIILETDTTLRDTIIGNKGYLKGRILNEVSLPPVCGTEAYGTVVEFEIIYFSDVMYTLKKIGVIFTCPEMYKENFFEVGKTYEIDLADQKQTSVEYTVPNEKLLQKYKLRSSLWAVSAKKLD